MTTYERWLRVLMLAYPREYRDRREDEIVATLLAAAPHETTRPSAREAVSLLVNGLRAHGVGQHVRSSAHAGLALAGTGAVGGVAAVIAAVVGVQVRIPGLAYPTRFWLLWATLAVVIVVLPICRRPRSRACRGALGTLPAVAAVTAGPGVMLVSRAYLVPMAALVVLGVLTPLDRRRVRVGAITAGAALGWLVASLVQLPPEPWALRPLPTQRWPYLYDAAWMSQATAVAVLGALVLVGLAARRRAPSVAIAVAVLLPPAATVVAAATTAIGTGDRQSWLLRITAAGLTVAAIVLLACAGAPSRPERVGRPVAG